jgi:hypothetical protein
MKKASVAMARRAAQLARDKREPLDWFVLVGKAAAWVRLTEEAEGRFWVYGWRTT